MVFCIAALVWQVWGERPLANAAPPAGGSRTPSLRLAVGEQGGTYWRFGEAIQQAASNGSCSFSIELLPTRGSSENAMLLAEGRAELAIVQNNVARQRVDMDGRLRGVMALYTEAIHLFGYHGEHVESVEDLHGLSIATGKKGSGTYEDSHRILNALGLYRNTYTAADLSMRDLATLTDAARPDAVFLIAGVPSPVMVSLSPQGRLIGLRDSEILKLRNRYEYLVPFTIQANRYPEQSMPVQTVGLRALLVAADEVPGTNVIELLEAIHADPAFRGLAAAHGESLNPNDAASRGMTFPLHDGARTFFRHRMIADKLVRQWMPDILICLLLVLSWIGTKYGSSAPFKAIRRSLYLRLIFVFATIYVLATIAIHLSEWARTPGFETVARAFWSTAVYVLSGLENREPRTPVGRVGLTVLLFSGIGMLGAITAKFAALFLDERERKMPADLKNHIVICNWNSRAETLVREIHANEAAPDVDIAVVCLNSAEEVRRLLGLVGPEDAAWKRVFLLHGDPRRHEILRMASVASARSVAILKDDAASGPDAQAAMITLAVRRVARERDHQDGRRIHVIVEGTDPQQRQLLLDAGADEIICPSQYGLSVLAQSVVHRNLAQVYEHLLHYSEKSSEIYVLSDRALPKNVAGCPYHKVALCIMNASDPANPVIPIGIQRESGECVVNPRGKLQSALLTPTDSLIVIAFTTPNLGHVDCSDLRES